MESVLSGLSLLIMLAIAGLLLASSRASARRIARKGRGADGRAPGRGRAGRYTPLGYAFTFTLATTWFLVSGLIGYRLDRREPFFADARWSGDVIWWQVWMGLVFACLAVYFWRTGLRGLRSDVYIPELAGRDAAAPPSRRIERR